MESYLWQVIRELRRKRGIEKPKVGEGVEACSKEECNEFLNMLQNGSDLPPYVTQSVEDRTVFFRKLVREEDALEPSREEVLEYIALRNLSAVEKISERIRIIGKLLLVSAVLALIAVNVRLAWWLFVDIKFEDTKGVICVIIMLIITCTFAFEIHEALKKFKREQR